MNTRNFLKSLALIGSAAAGCPGIFIPKFEPVKWKPKRKLIIECFEFKQYIIDDQEMYISFIRKRGAQYASQKWNLMSDEGVWPLNAGETIRE